MLKNLLIGLVLRLRAYFLHFTQPTSASARRNRIASDIWNGIGNLLENLDVLGFSFYSVSLPDEISRVKSRLPVHREWVLVVPGNELFSVFGIFATSRIVSASPKGSSVRSIKNPYQTLSPLAVTYQLFARVPRVLMNYR